MRPVTGVSASQVSRMFPSGPAGEMSGSGLRPSGRGDDRPSTFQVVTEGDPFGSGFIHQPRVSSRRPSGNSIVPSSPSGQPSTTAQ